MGRPILRDGRRAMIVCAESTYAGALLIRNLGPGASRLGGQGLEVDIIAKMFETFDETLGLCGLGAADEMLSAEVLVEGAVFEHVVGGREYGCGDGADGLLRSA